MQGPEKNSYKEFDNGKKFLRTKFPFPPITFLMVRPLASNAFLDIRSVCRIEKKIK